MRTRLVWPVVLLLSACPKVEEPPVARSKRAIPDPAPLVLPAGVEACATFGEVKDGKTCRLYDAEIKQFPANPDPLALRVASYERWLDLFSTPSGQASNRIFTQAFTATATEAEWSAPDKLHHWDGVGDSSLWTHTALIAAGLRYATTGSPADRDRMDDYARAALRFFVATGAKGYQARYVFAAVPPGSPSFDDVASQERAPNDVDPIEQVIPASILAETALFPAYLRDGIPNGENTIAVEPRWRGYPSIDQYSGPLASLPLVVPLLGDESLRARLSEEFTCFVRRLRVFRISHLRENAELSTTLASYFGSVGLQLEEGEPDITKPDEIWGFYLPQLNRKNTDTYERGCPAGPQFVPVEDEEFDGRDPQFQGKFVEFVLRQTTSGGKDAIDFAFFPSVRAGDALQMLAIAQAAYVLSGDAEFLRWHDELLVGTIGAPAVMGTFDALTLPKVCSNYYREHNLYMTEYANLLTQNDPAVKSVHDAVFADDWANRMGRLQNIPFELVLSAGTGASSPRLAGLLDGLRSFGGHPDVLDSPRRNYDTDNVTSPPPGVTIEVPGDADAAICEQSVRVFGIDIAGEPIDRTDRYASVALPPMKRLYDDFIWQRDPFDAARNHGGYQGMEQYPGLDLTLPYWIARYHGLIDDPKLVLAWQPVD